MNKNEFCLGQLPQTHYTALFEAALSRGICEEVWDGQAVFYVNMPCNEEDELTIEFANDGRSPDGQLIETARSVLQNIVEMDAAARAIPDDLDHNEYLRGIKISVDLAEFDYAATTVNTEWPVHFARGQDGGWQCLGIPKWNEPGAYHR